MTAGPIQKLFSIAHDANHTKLRKLIAYLKGLYKIFIYTILKHAQSQGQQKLIKSFNTHLITIKVHESSLLSVFMLLSLYNIDLG